MTNLLHCVERVQVFGVIIKFSLLTLLSTWDGLSTASRTSTAVGNVVHLLVEKYLLSFLLSVFVSSLTSIRRLVHGFGYCVEARDLQAGGFQTGRRQEMMLVSGVDRSIHTLSVASYETTM